MNPLPRQTATMTVTVVALTLALAGPGVGRAARAETTPAAEPPPALETPAEKIGYVIGLQVGASIAEMGVTVDLAALARGIEASLNGGPRLLSPAEEDQARKELSLQAQRHQARAQQELAVHNRQEGLSFLTQNKMQEGVTTTDSGLQYTVLVQGDGPKPGPTDRVRVHYTGTLIDGTEFDSSYRRGEPAVFPVNAVIAGWTEALQLMNVGSKYRLFIPSELAYGERGAGSTIGPNATLIFDVELLGIE